MKLERENYEMLGCMRWAESTFLWVVLMREKKLHDDERAEQYVVWTYNDQVDGLSSGSYFVNGSSESNKRSAYLEFFARCEQKSRS
jgi:hypothetical protein